MKTATITPRLAEHYKKDLVPQLAKKFGYKNVMENQFIGKNITDNVKTCYLY